MFKKILPHLKDLDRSSTDIEASVLVSIDGLVIATTLPLDNGDIDHLGAVCAGAFLLGHNTSEKCAGGMLEQVLIKCSKNQIVMTYAGTEAILAVIIKSSANVDHFSSNIKHSIEKIAAIF
jgi:predicted regulator of Ras-like GTPase activity (Roadblock/LC7/MglB family)